MMRFFRIGDPLCSEVYDLKFWVSECTVSPPIFSILRGMKPLNNGRGSEIGGFEATCS